MRLIPIVISMLVAAVVRIVAAQQSDAPANASETFASAAEWWDAKAEGDGTFLSPEERAALDAPYDPYGSVAATQRAAYLRVMPYIELVRAAGRMPTLARAPQDRHVESLAATSSHAARLLRLDVLHRVDRGDVSGALESLRAINGISRHLTAEGTLFASQRAAAVFAFQDSLLDETLGRGLVDSESAKVLIDDYSAFRGVDPTGAIRALEHDRATNRARVESTLAQPGGMNELRYLLGSMQGEPKELATKAFLEAGPEGVRADLDRYDAVIGEYANAMRVPDREDALRAVDAIDARVAAGEAGLVASLMTPAVRTLLVSRWAMQDLISRRIDMLESIRDGRALPSAYANAAHAYLRLAAIVRRLPDDAQRDIEALRVAGNALDAEFVAQVRRAIDPYREAILREFRVAATCERCDFPSVDMDSAILVRPIVAELRGALRVALADAVAGPAAPGQGEHARAGDIAPASATEAACFGIRLASHLAKARSISHGIVASSVLDEAASALRQAHGDGPLTDGDRSRLNAALATIDTNDPLGLRAAPMAHAERIVLECLGPYRGEPPHPELPRMQSLARRGNAWLSGLLLARQLFVTYESGVEALLAPSALAKPLLGLGDLIDTQAVEAMRDAGPSALRPAAPADDSPQDELDRLLALVVERPPADPTAAERRAMSAIAALSEITRSRPD